MSRGGVREIVFGKKSSYLKLIVLWAKVFRHSGRNCRQVCQMCILNAQRDFLGNSFAQQTKIKSICFRIFSAKLSYFFGKNITARTSKLDSPCREQRFSQSCLSWNFHNFFPVFGLWVKKFLIFVEFSKWVVKTILKCTGENLMKTFLERIKVSCFWRSLSNKFPNYRQFFLDRAFKTEVYVSRGFLQGKFFREYFSGLRAVNLAIFGETIIDYLSKPFSTVFEDFLEKNFELKKLYAFNT